MINFDDDTRENQIKHNPDWLYIPDHPYIIIIISGTGSGKKKIKLLNLINHLLDIEKFICMMTIHLRQNISFLIKNM